jgi:hypothetical protein
MRRAREKRSKLNDPLKNAPDPGRRVPQEHFTVTLRPDGVVWLARNDVVYPSIAAVNHAYDSFLSLVDDWLLSRRMQLGLLGKKARTPMGWLYDVRGAPELRNDPEFEKVVQQRRANLIERSPALAILVATAAGRMQLSRLMRQAKVELGVFNDFDEATAWLGRRMTQDFR